VLLQDVAVMQIKKRSHILFSDEPFVCPEFVDYQNQMSEHLTNTPDPNDNLIESLLPGLCGKINSMHSDINSKVVSLQASVKSMSSTMLTKMALQSFVNHVGNFKIDSNTINGTDVITEVAAGLAAGSKNESKSSEAAAYSTEPFHYALCNSYKSCQSVWHEWFGTNEFDPALNLFCFPGGVNGLEEKYSNSWRKNFSTADQKKFSRLKSIVKSISAIVEKADKNPDHLLNKLDAMLHEKKSTTLTAMDKFLKQYASQQQL
jgi:hypothetical protein